MSAKKSVGHVVPKALQESQRSASVRLVNDPARPAPLRLSHAEKTRTLLKRQKSGVLSTSSVDGQFPFGSIVNYALDANEDVFFFASALAEHTKNLEANGKASLFVSEELGDKEGDQLAVSRATVVGQVCKVSKTQQLIDLFQVRHPKAQYVRFEDFSVYQFQPVAKVRYIAGFGEMSWVSGDAFALARSDEVLLGSAHAVKHMNQDHAAENCNLVNAFANPPLPTKCTLASMLQIDRFGMDFLAVTPEGRTLARVGFPAPLQSAAQVKDAVVALSKQAKL